MGAGLGEARRLVEAAAGPDPETGLAAVVALRGLVEVLEDLSLGGPAEFGDGAGEHVLDQMPF